MSNYQMLYLLLLVFTALLIPSGRWAYRKVKQSGRNELSAEVEGSFIYDLGTNHLPHIYSALEKICSRLEIELPEPPPIRIMPLDKGSAKR